ncbi:hypothetical protein [Mucilaginibacter endophyticus]|uniref:hypothetical protein n=1 Tax=Mucilaginibacter endophyticus TaxID=2675003 RepID=UPI000E0CE09B|nr:hypothetical protein [Mucilaginibacter endophyticus]
MNKPISKNLHGLIDYTYAAIVPVLPELAGFRKRETAKVLCRSLGAGALTYTLLTKARWGLIPLLPFKAHLAIDLSVSCLALAAPWLLGFSRKKTARNALLAAGIIGLTASLLTDPEEKHGREQLIYSFNRQEIASQKMGLAG